MQNTSNRSCRAADKVSGMVCHDMIHGGHNNIEFFPKQNGLKKGNKNENWKKVLPPS